MLKFLHKNGMLITVTGKPNSVVAMSKLVPRIMADMAVCGTDCLIDPKLSPEAHAEGSEAVRQRLDVNGDGKFSATEVANALGGRTLDVVVQTLLGPIVEKQRQAAAKAKAETAAAKKEEEEEEAAAVAMAK